jgi:hypothetical protein
LAGVKVRKIADASPGQPGVELVDAAGVPVTDVTGFLRLLVVRDYSPNTVRAYAHDLQKLFVFLQSRGMTVQEFTPARAVEFIVWLRTQSSARKAQRLDLALTELELGRCLRLPQEGPCECDIYLTCPKFVTTPQYIPRLQERLRTEEQLIADATERGWAREVEGHRCIAGRIRALLDELEPQSP